MQRYLKRSDNLYFATAWLVANVLYNMDFETLLVVNTSGRSIREKKITNPYLCSELLLFAAQGTLNSDLVQYYLKFLVYSDQTKEKGKKKS